MRFDEQKSIQGDNFRVSGARNADTRRKFGEMR